MTVAPAGKQPLSSPPKLDAASPKLLAKVVAASPTIGAAACAPLITAFAAPEAASWMTGAAACAPLIAADAPA